VPSFREQLETAERWRRFPALERVDGAGLALTFDDGPDPDATPGVLDALAEAGTRATFFLVGEQVDAHPSLAAEVAARGHVVGLHGYLHVEHDELADPRSDLERGAAALAAATGERPASFALPTGASVRRRSRRAVSSGSGRSTGRPGAPTGSRSRPAGSRTWSFATSSPA
jgi:peptidoglycan/xylan/chitin deacetylase (PgdA/CDA1 family)